MSESSSPVPKKAKYDGDLRDLSQEQLIERVEKTQQDLDELQEKFKQQQSSHQEEITNLKRSLREASKRDNILVNRLVNKESEVTEIIAQLEEMKRSQTAGSQQLRALCLDPAVALMFSKLSVKLDEANKQAKQAQEELQAWKFTPDSQTGKRLIARCRQLLSENEELGVIISSGRIAKLEGDAALQKKLVDDIRHAHQELETTVGDMDGELEAVQSFVFQLQHELSTERQRCQQLTDRLNELTVRTDVTGASPASPQTSHVQHTNGIDSTHADTSWTPEVLNGDTQMTSPVRSPDAAPTDSRISKTRDVEADSTADALRTSAP